MSQSSQRRSSREKRASTVADSCCKPMRRSDVLRELDRTGLTKDTLCLHRDNGPAQHGWEERPRWPRRAGPGAAERRRLRRRARVPFIARWPGRIRAGAVRIARCASWYPGDSGRDAGYKARRRSAEDSFSYASVLLGKTAVAAAARSHANTGSRGGTGRS